MKTLREATGQGRRRRLLVHALPLVVLAALAFALGAHLAGGPGRADRAAAEAWVAAWARADWPGAYARLSDASRARVGRREFARLHARARATATVLAARAGDADERDGRVAVPVTVRTRVFGTVSGLLRLELEDEEVNWSPELVFPGLRPGERLTRTSRLPPRAALLARDGTPLARGPERTSPVPDVAVEIAGRLAPPEPGDASGLFARGYPTGSPVGASGLERIFEARLAGRPGGRLRAGPRVLASVRPRAAPAVRTTIDVEVERAAGSALAGRLGGVAAVDPRTGEVLALAGVAFSGLQPPGSTFKVVTTAGALRAGIVTPAEVFPVQTAAVLEGRQVQNAGGGACGGTFLVSFARSCNSVFAPLGAELGARRLLEAAEDFGFNRPLGIPGAAVSTVPPASLGDPLQIGVAALGQGLVQATTLQMALVAATVAAGGRRPALRLRPGGRSRFTRAFPERVASTTGRLMRAAVEDGTGVAAALPDVAVAGKTGTAELDATQGPTAAAEPARETSAWFIAFAPVRRPRIAVAVLLAEAGSGGAVAAPAAREVLAAGVARGR